MKHTRHVIASIAVWFIGSALLLRRYRGIFDMEPEDQKLMYYSESAFYLSFYYDVVDAPSWRAVWTTLTNDDRTEFPEVVVSFKRLNIAQEIALGSIYRLFNLKSVIQNPFSFYATTILLMNAGGVAALFLLACECSGGTVWGGLLFFGLYLSNCQEKLISRISALPLRENFAIPALWLSLLCLQRILGNNHKRKGYHYATLFASFLWMFLTWQLSLHIVSSQLGCLFLMNLFGRLSDQDLGDISRVALGALLSSWIMMLCPSFVITSQLTTGIIAILASNIVFGGGVGAAAATVPPTADGATKVSLRKTAHKVLLALTVFFFENTILSLTTRHDGHIITMLLSKLGLSKGTFDSQIYMLGSEFRPISEFVIGKILPTRLFQFVGVAMLVLTLVTLKNANPTAGLYKSFNCYLVLQVVVFSTMAALVSRLRVLALPLLCVFSSYSLLFMRLQYIKQKKMRGITILVAALVMSPYFTTLPLSEIKVPPFGERYNTASLKDLIHWVNRNVKPGTPILSDMPTSSALRATTSARIVLNPQFEYTPLRRKTHFFFTLGDCNDTRWFGEKMKELYHANIVIVPVKFCTIPRNGGQYSIQEVMALNPLGKCPPQTPYHRRMCNRLWAGDSHFEHLFGNDRYLVFRYRGMVEVANDPMWESMHRLDHYKPWIENHVKSDLATGPKQIASTALTLKKHFNLPVVLPMLQYGLEVFPGNESMLRLYAEAMDYDFAMFEEAKKYYAQVFSLLNSRCSTPADLLFYMSYVGHMLDTGTGEDSEILRVIKASEKCLNLQYTRDSGLDLCEYAVTLLGALQKRQGTKLLKVRDVALRFFRLAQDVNHQNVCFFTNYTLFTSKKLTILEVVVMFLTKR